MYRWILSLLALLGCAGMVAQAQQSPQTNRSHLGQTNFDKSGKNGVADGSTHP